MQDVRMERKGENERRTIYICKSPESKLRNTVACPCVLSIKIHPASCGFYWSSCPLIIHDLMNFATPSEVMPKYHITSFEDRWHSGRVFLIRDVGGGGKVGTANYRDRRKGVEDARWEWRRIYTVATVLYDWGERSALEWCDLKNKVVQLTVHESCPKDWE